MSVFHALVSLIILSFLRLEATKDTTTEKVLVNSGAAEDLTAGSEIGARVFLMCRKMQSFTVQSIQENDSMYSTLEPLSEQNSIFSVVNSSSFRRMSKLTPEETAGELPRLSTLPTPEAGVERAEIVQTEHEHPKHDTVDDVRHQEMVKGKQACNWFKQAPVTSFTRLSASCSTMSDQRLCGCTSTCLFLNNCCGDSTEIESTMQTTLTPVDVPVSCRTNVSSNWWFSSSSLVVDSCPDDWSHDEVRDRCTNPQRQDILSYVPCHSARVGLNYLNIYCAHCHKVTDCTAWQISFQSRYPIRFENINTYKKMSNIRVHDKAKFVLSPPHGIEPVHCLPNLIDRCQAPLKTEFSSALCRSYYSPVLVDRVVYRNIHCYSCFTQKNISLADKETMPRARPNAMSILLEVGSSRRLFKSGRTGIDGGLVIKRIRGYDTRVAFHISVNFTENSPAPPKQIYRNTNAFIQKTIMGTITSKLKSFKHRVRAEWVNVDELKHGTPIVIQVTIMEDMPVEFIPIINSAISSVHFEIQLSNGINVRCCYDENGDKMGEDNKISDRSEFHEKALGSTNGGTRTFHYWNQIFPLIDILLPFMYVCMYG